MSTPSPRFAPRWFWAWLTYGKGGQGRVRVYARNAAHAADLIRAAGYAYSGLPKRLLNYDAKGPLWLVEQF